MFIKVEGNKLINKKYIKTVELQGFTAYLRDKKDRLMGWKKFETEEQVEEFCDELMYDEVAGAINLLDQTIDESGYDISLIAEEVQKLRKII